MPAPVYASATDLTAYCAPDTAPSGVGERQLREASAQVDEMLLTAIYKVDADEKPTEPKVIEALKNATCAQALHVDEHGDEVEIAESGGAMSLGPLSYGGRRGSGGGSSGSSVPVWSPRAIAFLRAAGLIVGPVLT